MAIPLRRGGRAVLVEGVRTPSARRGTALRHLAALDLGRRCVAELIGRGGAEPGRVDQLITSDLAAGAANLEEAASRYG